MGRQIVQKSGAGFHFHLLRRAASLWASQRPAGGARYAWTCAKTPCSNGAHRCGVTKKEWVCGSSKHGARSRPGLRGQVMTGLCRRNCPGQSWPILWQVPTSHFQRPSCRVSGSVPRSLSSSSSTIFIGAAGGCASLQLRWTALPAWEGSAYPSAVRGSLSTTRPASLSSRRSPSWKQEEGVH